LVLLRTLRLLSGAARSDPTLGEEIESGRGRGGRSLAAVRSRLVGWVGELSAAVGGGGDDADALADLLDAVFEIRPPPSTPPSSPSSLLRPSSRMPLTDDELRRRLPLVHDLTSHLRSRRAAGDGRRPPADVVLAADIICRPEDAVAASMTIRDALRPGGVALVVCANAEHRYGVDIFPGECERRGLKVTSTDAADMLWDGGGGLPGGRDAMMETAAGYVNGMRMTFFEITKMI
jgi:hypothetical protein